MQSRKEIPELLSSPPSTQGSPEPRKSAKESLERAFLAGRPGSLKECVPEPQKSPKRVSSQRRRNDDKNDFLRGRVKRGGSAGGSKRGSTGDPS